MYMSDQAVLEQITSATLGLIRTRAERIGPSPEARMNDVKALIIESDEIKATVAEFLGRE
jgi:hypothetical protein